MTESCLTENDDKIWRVVANSKFIQDNNLTSEFSYKV
jgi:hypothetical protein